MNSEADPDAVWRRPTDSDPAVSEPTGTTDQPAGYTGPPRGGPPPRYLRAPVIQQLPPPRALPPQDHAEIDAEEQQARVVTYVVAIVFGVLVVLLMLFIALRALST